MRSTACMQACSCRRCMHACMQPGMHGTPMLPAHATKRNAVSPSAHSSGDRALVVCVMSMIWPPPTGQPTFAMPLCPSTLSVNPSATNTDSSSSGGGGGRAVRRRSDMSLVSGGDWHRINLPRP
eukprot:352231-Chlamydomonas_euryale.AAC.12